MSKKSSVIDYNTTAASEPQKEIGVNEIKLTKILIDKPAPLLSAQSWVVVD